MPEFQFDSLNSFIVMGGHGIYVWLCTAIALILLSGLLLHPLYKHKKLLNQIQRQERIAQSQRDRHQRQ